MRPPNPCTFYDPPTDPDAASDSESLAVRIFSRMAYEKKPTHFPADEWIVRASLAILERKKPDFGVILLAQMDDAQHGLGAIGSLAEFKEKWHLFTGTVDESRYNPDVWKGPIVDAVRDVDIQFGRLIDGLRKIPYYRDATIILYSDHGHRTHRDTLLQHFDPRLNTNPLDVLGEAGFLTRRAQKGMAILLYPATSFGMAT